MTTEAAPPRKKRPPPQTVTVTDIERVTPRLLRIGFTGAGLAPFAAAKPAAHMKLFFPEGAWPPPEGVENAPRPPSRTYTPRRFDSARSRLEIEFVLHGVGIASEWAERVKPGDAAHVSAGPGGGWVAPEAVENIVLVVDETAMPAAGMIIEALPKACGVTALCEIADAAEERALSPTAACAPRWLHREPANAAPGALLEAAVAALPNMPVNTHWVIACESGAMRRIRDHVVRERGGERARMHTRGYWKAGATNHPDHDYGDD